jgi:hypothetical protein
MRAVLRVTSDSACSSGKPCSVTQARTCSERTRGLLMEASDEAVRHAGSPPASR